MAHALLASIVALSSARGLEVRALPQGQASPPATVEDVAWLEGRWIGEGLGGCAEENIAAPVAGQIMGMFRQTKADGTLWFYEFYTIAPRGDSIAVRIKHFDPDLSGWEDRDGFVEFPLVALEKDAVYFDGLSYALDGKHGLKAAVRIGDRETGEFALHKAVAGERCPSATRP